MRNRTREETRQKIVKLWNDGLSVLEIRDEMGYKCTKAIESQLRLAGISPRGVDGLDVSKVIALQKAGWNMDKIVDEFAYNYTAEYIAAEVNKFNDRSQKGKNV